MEITSSVPAVTMSGTSVKGEPAKENENNVQFVVKYPEDYTGPKFMPEGLTVVSKESAALFIERGIGHIAGDEEDTLKENPGKKDEDINAGNGNPDYSKMTKDALMSLLDEKGIEYKSSASKQDLIDLLTAE